MSDTYFKMLFYIHVIREESSWGKKQSIEKYCFYAQREFDELKYAIQLTDTANINEELADVYMMIEFFKQELIDSIEYREEGVKKQNYLQDLGKIYDLLDQEKKKSFSEILIVKKIENYFLEEKNKYNISIDDICSIVCNKLEDRYPYLLPNQQLTLDGHYWSEESRWKDRKRLHKLMEFCTCTNNNCINHNKAYNGTNLELIDSTSGRSTYIICKLCRHRLCMDKADLFYNFDIDYKVALRAVIEYNQTKNTEEICTRYQITPRMLTSLRKRCENRQEHFNDILLNRYHINTFTESNYREGKEGKNETISEVNRFNGK